MLSLLRETLRTRRPRQILTLLKLAGFRQTISFLLQRLCDLPLTSLWVKEIAFPIYLRPGTSDWTALCQVLLERDSDVTFTREPRFIVDGGANVGFASVLLANKYPRSQILAVEPHHDNAVMFRLNCRHYSNVELITSAIWSSKTSLEIANPHSPIHGGFRVRPADSSSAFEAVTVDELLRQTGHHEIDLLKLDIEGAEEEIFSSNYREWIERTRILAIECHGESAFRAVHRAISELGHFRSYQRGEKLIFVRV